MIIDEKGVALLGTIESERPLPLGQLDWFRDTRFVPGHIHPCAVRSLISVRR